MAAKRGGAQPLRPALRRSEKVLLSLTKSEVREVRRKARAEDTSPSVLLRRAALEHLGIEEGGQR